MIEDILKLEKLYNLSVNALEPQYNEGKKMPTLTISRFLPHFRLCNCPVMACKSFLFTSKIACNLEKHNITSICRDCLTSYRTKEFLGRYELLCLANDPSIIFLKRRMI